MQVVGDSFFIDGFCSPEGGGWRQMGERIMDTKRRDARQRSLFHIGTHAKQLETGIYKTTVLFSSSRNGAELFTSPHVAVGELDAGTDPLPGERLAAPVLLVKVDEDGGVVLGNLSVYCPRVNLPLRDGCRLVLLRRRVLFFPPPRSAPRPGGSEDVCVRPFTSHSFYV